MTDPSAPVSKQLTTKTKQGEFRDERQTKLAVMILAKDEERNIGRILDAIAAQTLCFRPDLKISVYVIANGCTDQTAQRARERAATSLRPLGISTETYDWAAAGKSRSWNRVVHEVIPSDVEYILALDADIGFANDEVMVALLDHMQSNRTLEVVSGFAVKDTVRKVRPTLIERFSNSISRHTRHSGVINGSLYLARASCLREIWLPDETPGEDGFLNAMVMTRGFSREERTEVVSQLSEPTHYFQGHSAISYFAHEKRMIVGTMINVWIFEYLNSLKLSDPAGLLIQNHNSTDPEWVERLVKERSDKKWLIPSTLLFRRLIPTNGLTFSYLMRLPFFVGATLLTLPPALMANQALKKRGASSLW